MYNFLIIYNKVLKPLLFILIRFTILIKFRECLCFIQTFVWWQVGTIFKLQYLN